MIANDILLDAFTRVHDSLHRTLGDITDEELVQEPHPSIGWLAWRISRVMDSNVTRRFPAASSCGSAKDGLRGSVCTRTGGLCSVGTTHARASQGFPSCREPLLDYHDAAYGE